MFFGTVRPPHSDDASGEKEKTTEQEHAHGASDGYNMCLYGRWWRSVIVNLCIHADATQKTHCINIHFAIFTENAHSFSYAFVSNVSKKMIKKGHTQTKHNILIVWTYQARSQANTLRWKLGSNVRISHPNWYCI